LFKNLKERVNYIVWLGTEFGGIEAGGTYSYQCAVRGLMFQII